MIYVGTAGIPLGCKGKSTADGVFCVSRLGLSAMEVEFVRGVKMSDDAAKKVKITSEKFNVKLSVHAPYYVNLSSPEKEKVEASKERILKSARLGNLMNAGIVVIHAGFYMENSRERAYELIKNSLAEVREILDSENNGIILGIETMGRQKQFGTLDEAVNLSLEVEKTQPVIDFGHIHARGSGCLKTQDDFSKIFNKIEDTLGKIHVHSHLSGIYYKNGNEKYHLTIDSKEPDYTLLAKEITERKQDITLISESPNIEFDALKFKNYLILMI
jgi:deoxyribonuclease-4